MGFEAARSLPDGSWNSKHEAGKLRGGGGLRAEREGAAGDPCDGPPGTPAMALRRACRVSRCLSKSVHLAESRGCVSLSEPKKPIS